MCTTLVLTTPNFTKRFIVEYDASGHGIGAVLMKEGRTISFESRKLKVKNLLSFMKNNVDKKCPPYLIGRLFKLKHIMIV